MQHPPLQQQPFGTAGSEKGLGREGQGAEPGPSSSALLQLSHEGAFTHSAEGGGGAPPPSGEVRDECGHAAAGMHVVIFSFYAHVKQGGRRPYSGLEID